MRSVIFTWRRIVRSPESELKQRSFAAAAAAALTSRLHSFNLLLASQIQTGLMRPHRSALGFGTAYASRQHRRREPVEGCKGEIETGVSGSLNVRATG